MEYLIEGSPIFVMDDMHTVAEAMVVSADFKVKAVGDRKMLQQNFPRARRLDVDGGAIIPAFNDCHAHLLRLGLDMTRADLRYCRFVDEIRDALWGNDLHREGGWLIGVNYDQNILPGQNHLSLDELDRLGKGRPLYLFHLSRHEGLANSKAMELAGITATTPDPPEGKIDRDESGRPTGRFLEMAVSLVEKVLPAPTDVELEKAIQAALGYQARRGILAATDATSGKWFGMEREWAAYSSVLSQKMGGQVKVTLMPDVEVCQSLDWLDRDNVELPTAPRGLSLGPMKIIADGAITNRTAALKKPYEDVGGFGQLVYPAEKLKAMIIRAHRGGWPCAVHAIGDKVIELCLDAFAEARQDGSGLTLQHRLEHCMVVDDRINYRMAELGIIPCVQPEFIFHLGHAYRICLARRADMLMPYRSWLNAGLTLAFGSDQPITTGDPILSWRAAVERQTRDGDIMGAGERISPMEALRAYTVGSAIACGDPEIGTLEPGKEARFVVLSHRPELITQKEMRVLTTSAELLPIRHFEDYPIL
jgi:predicted amidohydrolase YtcJ